MLVCVSGYFDPLHIGHIEYFKKAKQMGQELVVIVNNDFQACLKKGRPFMPVKERAEIIRELKCVDRVVESIDTDRTVRNTLKTMEPCPDLFCNGGDQNNQTIPETEVCRERGIELLDGLGEKIQSSSWLLKNVNMNTSKKIIKKKNGKKWHFFRDRRRSVRLVT